MILFNQQASNNDHFVDVGKPITGTQALHKE